jgi:hypothetical protein
MAANDPVETQTPVFTEQEVFMVAAFVAIRLGLDDEARVLSATAEAIPAVLSRERSA